MNYIKKIVLFTAILSITINFAQENHLKNITKLTNGGDNAEAYFSPNSQQLTMQVSNPKAGVACDQIFLYDLQAKQYNSENLKLISTGKGRTTCSYFMPDGKHVLYASTHESSVDCPEPPKSKDGKYLWAVYPEFDIYIADLNGNITKN